MIESYKKMRKRIATSEKNAYECVRMMLAVLAFAGIVTIPVAIYYLVANFSVSTKIVAVAVVGITDFAIDVTVYAIKRTPWFRMRRDYFFIKKRKEIILEREFDQLENEGKVSKFGQLQDRLAAVKPLRWFLCISCPVIIPILYFLALYFFVEFTILGLVKGILVLIFVGEWMSLVVKTYQMWVITKAEKILTEKEERYQEMMKRVTGGG